MLRNFCKNIMGVRQAGKNFLQKNPVSRVEGKIGSRVMFDFLHHLTEEPKAATATQTGISLYQFGRNTMPTRSRVITTAVP